MNEVSVRGPSARGQTLLSTREKPECEDCARAFGQGPSLREHQDAHRGHVPAVNGTLQQMLSPPLPSEHPHWRAALSVYRVWEGCPQPVFSQHQSTRTGETL